MARRYTRREFLTDASFALGSSVLLKVFAPQPASTQTQTAEVATTPAVSGKLPG